jgi:hypothetical protein
VNGAILEFLADGASGFGGSRGLELDYLDEVWDAGEVVFFVGLGCEPFYRDGYR